MTFTKTTEQSSKYEHLEKMSVSELLSNINQEDKTVPFAVEKALPQIEILVTQIVAKMKLGGRLFYIGAGTSGRLGVVDASECPPTFGVPFDLVVGIIAGGDKAILVDVGGLECLHEPRGYPPTPARRFRGAAPGRQTASWTNNHGPAGGGGFKFRPHRGRTGTSPKRLIFQGT